MFRRVLVLAAVVAAVGVTTALASAPSPVGTWKAQNQRIYKWIPYQGNGFEEHSMTQHLTTTKKCVVHVNDAVYRYLPVAGGHYRLTTKWWNSQCVPHWEYDSTRDITVTATRMFLSCDKEWTKVCFAYTRVNTDTQAPTVQALQSTGSAGGDASLHYTVKDNSGKTHEELTLYRVVERRPPLQDEPRPGAVRPRVRLQADGHPVGHDGHVQVVPPLVRRGGQCESPELLDADDQVAVTATTQRVLPQA